MGTHHAVRPERDRAGTLWRELRGVVERITFQNPENGFTVARLAPERRDAEAAATADDERLVTLVGTLPDLQPGEAIAAKGWWKNDPKHGWQFQALAYRTTLPATLQGMKRYLGSGLVKGIKRSAAPTSAAAGKPTPRPAPGRGSACPRRGGVYCTGGGWFRSRLSRSRCWLAAPQARSSSLICPWRRSSRSCT